MDNRPLLAHDNRLKTLLPADCPARAPVAGRFFTDAGVAAAHRDIDHSALLDALWKVRSAETLFAEHAKTTTCPATRRILLGHQADELATIAADIERLLELKAEAEIHAIPELARAS